MTVLKKLSNSRQEELEWQARVDLAAAFQLTYQFGWNRGIGNHYSLMVPDSDDTFFVNARGLLFSEITASNLIRCDFKTLSPKMQAAIRRLAPALAAGPATRP